MSSIRAQAYKVAEAADITPVSAAWMLGVLYSAGLKGEDGATSLIAYLTTPEGQSHGADGIRAYEVLKEHQQ